MDVKVIAAKGNTVWQLTDLLGRSMGTIRENASHQFTIYPEGHAFETMAETYGAARMPRRRPGRDRKAHSGRLPTLYRRRSALV